METFWWLEKLTVPAVLTIRPLSNWYKSVLNEWLCPSCGCNHTLSPTVCPYPWLLLQRLLLEMILLVLVADQSQSLTWVMAMLSTVLSSAALPWWQKERVPACQRKGSAESWRVTESLTFLSVWLTAPPFIDTETHTHTGTMTGWQWKVFMFFVESRSPCSLTCFYQSTLKFCHFFSLVTSRSSVYEFRSRVLPFKASVEAAYLQTSSPIAPDSGPASHSYNFAPTLFAQLSSEYPMMEWPLYSSVGRLSHCLMKWNL